MRWIVTLFALSMVWGCNTALEPDGRGESVGYRSGTSADGYTSNGERGNITITEVFWTGSVRETDNGIVFDRGDVFVELQNKHPRPIYLTGWLLKIESGLADEGIDKPSRRYRSEQTFVLPAPANGQPLYPNDYAIVAAKNTGAFPNAQFVIEDFRLPDGPFEITLRDLDERLIDHIGDDRKPPFAGSWDGVTSRSMERIQLIFNNRGGRDAAWHSYSLNDFDRDARAALHRDLRSNIQPEYRKRTFATPGFPNSPDYSGNTSAGDFQ